jgi:predicted nucleic acid-binding protein
MPDMVIADTSFLIAIQKMQLFNEIRTLYQNVIITKKIAEEFQLDLPEWILIKEPRHIEIQAVLSLTLDAGEASAIALAYNYKDVILIVDDLKARKEALALGFKITGTLGVLFKLKEMGLIPSLKQKVLQLTEIGFRINPKIIEEILKNAGEK